MHSTQSVWFLVVLYCLKIIIMPVSAIYVPHENKYTDINLLQFIGNDYGDIANNNYNNNSTMSVLQQRLRRSYDGVNTEKHSILGDASGASNSDATTINNEEGKLARRQKREFSDWLIAPNTRWCGRGNTANGTYNHLGGASAADKCCRKHDHCALYIPGMSNRYELFNYRPYTLSHCNCDRRFRTCLKMANDEDANTIGKLFFNIVQTQCFVLRYEKVCHKKAPDGTCEKHDTKQKAYLKSNKRF